MPKWTEYTSKDTLADNDEVMLYDATARANKRGLMSKFWDYVVDKMSTAVIGKLETENKTIIGAINYINNQTKGVCSSDDIKDLNNFGKTNTEIISGIAYSKALNFIPDEASFVNVFYIPSWSGYGMQFAATPDGGKIYMRVNSKQNWSKWVKLNINA